MKSRFIPCLICALILFVTVCYAKDTDSFLSKPTGIYGVAFEDFHWIDQGNCPDFNYNGTNKDDFSPDNTKYCHEIVSRIYYPSNTPIQPGAAYYEPLIKMWLDAFSQDNGIFTWMLDQVREIQSYSQEKASIIVNKKFPVLLFAPGAGGSAELYENFITELVSQGYIVVGINTPFIDLVALPNGHVVKPVEQPDFDKFLQLQMRDLIYVLTQIKNLPNSDHLFAAMDFSHIGAFGHSLGGESVGNIAQTNPKLFQAIATLDMPVSPESILRKKFIIPCMHMVDAKIFSIVPKDVYELGQYGYLAVLSPNEKDLKYSDHMNFSDYSTIQYLPAAQLYTKHSGDGPLLGNGNGWEITASINDYLVGFFNTFLKTKINKKLLNCTALTNNTYIQCGKLNSNSDGSKSGSGSIASALGIAGAGIAIVAAGAYLINSP